MLNISTAADIDRDLTWLRLSPAELSRRSGVAPSRLAKLRRGAARLQEADRLKLGAALADRLAELQSQSTLHFKAVHRE